MLELAINQGYDIREQSSMLTKIVPDEGINKQVKYRSIPIGVWGGRIGVLCRDDMINMLTKFQSAAREHCYKENNTFDQDISVVIREMDQYKSFSNYYFYSAQKPILTPNTSTSNISSINYNANQSISGNSSISYSNSDHNSHSHSSNHSNNNNNEKKPNSLAPVIINPKSL